MIQRTPDSDGGQPTATIPINGELTASEQAAIDSLATRADLLGYADDPELMGAFVKKLVGRIRAAIKRRRAAKGGGAQPGGFTFSTPGMRAAVGPGGLVVQRQAPAEYETPGPVAAPSSAAGLVERVKENPLLLIVPAAAIGAILLLGKKHKGA
jgi:hypothetical protein